MININLQIDPLQDNALKTLSSTWGLSRSALIRNLLYTAIKMARSGALKLDIAPKCSPTMERTQNCRIQSGKWVLVDDWGLVTGLAPPMATLQVPPPAVTDEEAKAAWEAVAKIKPERDISGW